MLSRERYLNAIESYVYLQQKHSDIGFVEKEALLAEHYRTQIAIESLGLQFPLPIPSELPHINEIVFPDVSETQPFKITSTSIIGMPNGGKTTTIETMAETREHETPATFDEIYREEKIKLDKQREFDFATLFESVLIRQYPEYIDATYKAKHLYDAGLIIEPFNIFDRLCWTDLPMIRTHFVLGNIKTRVLQTFENLFLSTFTLENELTNNVVISALITPKLSFERQDPAEHQGRIMNPPFLYMLYEQYIRFHYEMLNFEKVYKRKRDFTYCAVDMSSNDGHERFRSLEKAINWTHIGLSGVYTTESINEQIKKKF